MPSALLILIILALFNSPRESWAGQSPSAAESTMVRIPAGNYKTGFKIDQALSECRKHNDPCKREWFEDEEPIHTIYLNSYLMDKFEVTQEEFAREMVNNPSEFKGSHLPVEKVTWQEAQQYCKLTGKRLPTEAEWEVAAKGGEEIIYSWGNEVQSGRANFCDRHCEKRWKAKQFNDGFKTTAPVGSFPPNGYGLHDMGGNVYEWVFDWYGKEYYRSSPTKNPKGPLTGTYKVMRGGSWINYAVGTRPADRTDARPDKRLNFVGFRCAK